MPSVFTKIDEWWKENGFLTAIFIAFVLLAIASYMSSKGTSTKYRNLNDFLEIARGGGVKPKKESNKLKYESRCRDVLEDYFGVEFNKIRPDFLRNPETGRNMEIDMFNEELGLGLEYNGSQHYHFNPFWHQNEEGFEKQKYRDKLKMRLCKENNVNIIVVPYNVPYDEIKPYILEKLEALGY